MTRPALLRAALAAAAAASASPPLARASDEASPPPADPVPLTLSDLTDMASHLRDGDSRLFRPSPTPSTRDRQRSGGCDRLPSVLSVLTDVSSSPDLDRWTKAAEVAALCATDHDGHRAKIGRTEGVYKSVVSILELFPRGGSPDAAARAAELVWILSFNSGLNVGGFADAGAIDALGAIAVDCAPGTEGREDGGAACDPHVRMWTAAALQNLAASYCDTDDGRCWWEWSEDGSDLILNDGSPLAADGGPNRERMLAMDGLVDALVAEACAGPVRDGDGRPDQSVPWPGDDAEVGRDEGKSSLVPWAAAGALKNLALGGAGREAVRPAAVCLCALSASPDWLEKSKGEDALYHLGLDDACHFWEDVEEVVEEDGEVLERELIGGYCIDLDWTHRYEDGTDTCMEYPDEETCENHGEQLDEEGGLTANEACCMCGGGERDDVDDWRGDEL